MAAAAAARRHGYGAVFHPRGKDARPSFDDLYIRCRLTLDRTAGLRPNRAAAVASRMTKQTVIQTVSCGYT